MKVGAWFWPMAFPAARCSVCGFPVEIDDGIPDVDAEGRTLGWHHAEDCGDED